MEHLGLTLSNTQPPSPFFPLPIEVIKSCFFPSLLRVKAAPNCQLSSDLIEKEIFSFLEEQIRPLYRGRSNYNLANGIRELLLCVN